MPKQLYPPDLGGVFSSDVHRHVAGSLPLPVNNVLPPLTLHELFVRTESDPAVLLLDEDALLAIVEELIADGDVQQDTAPRLQRPIPGTEQYEVLPARLEDGELILVPKRDVQLEDDEEIQVTVYQLTEQGTDSLTGPNGFEPPPLTGEDLAKAKAFDAELRAKEKADTKAAAEARVERLKEELAEAEAALGDS